MQYREWKARATAELARAYKVWPPRIPEHVWRDAYISGNSPEEGAAVAEFYDRNSRPVKLKSSAITAGLRAIYEKTAEANAMVPVLTSQLKSR